MQGELEEIETKMTLSWPQAAPVLDGSFVSWHAQELVQTHVKTRCTEDEAPAFVQGKSQ